MELNFIEQLEKGFYRLVAFVLQSSALMELQTIIMTKIKLY